MAHDHQKRPASVLSINVASLRPAPDRCVTPAEGLFPSHSLSVGQRIHPGLAAPLPSCWSRCLRSSGPDHRLTTLASVVLRPNPNLLYLQGFPPPWRSSLLALHPAPGGGRPAPSWGTLLPS